MPKPLLITTLIVLSVVFFATGKNGWDVVGLFIVIFTLNAVIRIIRKHWYFKSDYFQALKAQVASIVTEHNDIVNYVSEIRSNGSFELGASSSGQHAHLATFENTSSWKTRRDRNVAEYVPHVHNTSLQVVRKASQEPIKYLLKYFGIKADHTTLIDVQRVSNDIARLEEAVNNIKIREIELTAQIKPPGFILKHYSKDFWEQIGVQLSPIQVPVPKYKFQYISAGGNTSQEVKIQLDTPTLEALSSALEEKIKWAKSAAGQRALMTARLRNFIKERDGYACMECGISVAAEPHLLLEVDHIIPVSKGGFSIPKNLQTLCWRCNRRKGAKIAI